MPRVSEMAALRRAAFKGSARHTMRVGRNIYTAAATAAGQTDAMVTMRTLQHNNMTKT